MKVSFFHTILFFIFSLYIPYSYLYNYLRVFFTCSIFLIYASSNSHFFNSSFLFCHIIDKLLYSIYAGTHSFFIAPSNAARFFYCIYRHMMSIVYNLYSILLCAKYHFQCKNIIQAMYYILQSNVSVAVFRVDVN